MKKNWTRPELEVTTFYVEDVIAASNWGDDDLDEYFTETGGNSDGWTDFH